MKFLINNGVTYDQLLKWYRLLEKFIAEGPVTLYTEDPKFLIETYEDITGESIPDTLTIEEPPEPDFLTSPVPPTIDFNLFDSPVDHREYKTPKYTKGKRNNHWE